MAPMENSGDAHGMRGVPKGLQAVVLRTEHGPRQNHGRHEAHPELVRTLEKLRRKEGDFGAAA